MHSLRISRRSRARIRARDRLPSAPRIKQSALQRAQRDRCLLRRRIHRRVRITGRARRSPVFDLTEPTRTTSLRTACVVHNCSEYVFIDDTACNLASMNLVKFLNADGNFDAKRFAEASRIWTTTLEISVTMGQMPSKKIAEKNHGYRTLGLGYANLGTLLMRMGLPYDSEEGFGWCAAIYVADDRHGISHVGRNGAATRAVRALRSEPRADAARHPQPSPRRIRCARPSEYEGLTRQAGYARADAVHARNVGAGAQDVGRCARDRRGRRLPQRADRRDRSDRDHRPGDGLRYDRHRARLRAGEVQEARRRRLLQDRQSVGRAALRQLGYSRRADRRDRNVRQGHRHARRRAAHQPRDAARQRASTTRRSRASKQRCRARSNCRSSSTSSCSAKSSAKRSSA